MKIMIIGSGGREHALTWKIAKSPLAEKIYCVPGNPGTASLTENVEIDISDFDALIDFALEKKIDLTVVGPEIPLVAGITDAFEAAGLSVFGPVKAAAKLEGSKAFAKDLMQKYDIPTAAYSTFDDYDDALTYIMSYPKTPVVLKADGLAAGKGVLICQNKQEAFDALKAIMQDKEFGAAGKKLVIEEFMQGDEVSIFVLCDGKNYRILPPAQDHKKIHEGDRGKNTGGMGAYAPAPLATADLIRKTEERIIKPTLVAMRDRGNPYRGLLYLGLMVRDGDPFVVEYNVRFGDPETQVVLPLIKSDLLPLLKACADGDIESEKIELYNQWTLGVVLVSGGYPDAYEKGKVISGLENVDKETLIFHAGTKMREQELVTSGGRVLNLVTLGSSFKACAAKAYSEAEKVSFEKIYYRKDIGFKVLH